MNLISRRLALALVLLSPAAVLSAQTVDEVIAKSVAASGGRAALLKVKSRSMTGTITLSTPGGEIVGSVEILNAAPNKSRSVIKADLSALGAGPLTIDQRFDGTAGYVLDTLQGNRDITGGQLDNLRNGSFPSSFLTYKEMGISKPTFRSGRSSRSASRSSVKKWSRQRTCRTIGKWTASRCRSC